MYFDSKAVRIPGLLSIITLLAFTCLSSVFAQNNQFITAYDRLLRVEINAKSDDETYRLAPMGKLGVVLFYKSLESVDQDKIRWYFSLYDKDLKMIWTKSIPLGNGFDIVNYFSGQDTLFLLFRISGKDKDAPYNGQVITLALQQGSFTGNAMRFPSGSEITGFKVSSPFVFTGVNLKNQSAQILKLDLKTGNQVKLTLSGDIPSTLSEFVTDSSGSVLFAGYRKFNSRNQSEVFISVFNSSGLRSSDQLISPITAEHELKTFRFLPLSNGEIAVAGTYGTPTVQKAGSKDHPEESTGFFFTKLQNNQQQSIIFYNFLELNNAGIFVGEKDIQSIKKKALKKNKSLNNYSADITLLLHPLQKKYGEIVLMGESFYPQYHSENFTDFDFYGRPFTNTYSVFDGYRYASALVAGFDKNGKLLWDNSMEIRDVLSFTLTPMVNLFSSEDNLVLACLESGKIVCKIFQGDKVVERTDYIPVDLGYPNDKLISETKGRMIPWYDNFFLCYGYQEIKNVSLENNNRRLVYYFNKIKFD